MVATKKPLKLSRESYVENVARTPAEKDPLATVLVFVPTSLIPDSWDYFIPQELSADIAIGALVRIPFGGKMLEGIVTSRRAAGPENSYKFIHSPLSRIPPVSPQQLEILPALAARYGCSQSEMVQSFFPPLSKTGERSALTIVKSPPMVSAHATMRRLHIVPISSNLHAEILRIAQSEAFPGKKVFIFPELHQLEACKRFLTAHDLSSVVLHSGLSKSQRYQNYLEANYMNSGIVLSLRNGAFLHGTSADLFVTIDDVEPTHYEGRSPSWNSRDVLLLRSNQVNILFLSHAPSLETVRLVDRGWLTFEEGRSIRKKIIAQERNPESSSHGTISSALKVGSVLIIHNIKGAIKSFTCSQCRNIAMCDCGGKLTLEAISANPVCSICAKEDVNWKCRWCDTMKPRFAQKGIDFSAKEFAASFPGVPVLISTADHRIEEVPIEHSLILATTSCEPLGHYSAIVYFNADRDFASPTMRSQERTRNHWSKLLTLLDSDGTLFLEMPSSHSSVQDLIKGRPLDAARKEIIERDELHLPPNFRIISLFGGTTELQRVLPILIEQDVNFVGPFDDEQSRSKIVIKVGHDSAPQVIETLVGINRVQGAKDRPLFSIHVDPAEL